MEDVVTFNFLTVSPMSPYVEHISSYNCFFFSTENHIEPADTRANVREKTFITDVVTVFDGACVFVCVRVAGIISTGDEDEAEGPVEKANGEV